MMSSSEIPGESVLSEGMLGVDDATLILGEAGRLRKTRTSRGPVGRVHSPGIGSWPQLGAI